ncbi:MAG: helix-turn-helix domain-containing protein [Myxococcota bacterium]
MSVTEAPKNHDSFDPDFGIPSRYMSEMAGDAHVADESARSRVRRVDLIRVHQARTGALDDELFGMFRYAAPKGFFASWLRTAVRLRTLGEVLESAIDTYGLLDRHAPWCLNEEGLACVLQLRPRTQRQRSSLLFNHMMLLAPLRIAQWLSGERIQPTRVWLSAFFEKYAADVSMTFGVDVVLGEFSAVSFDRGFLALPTVRSREQADRWVRERSLLAISAANGLGSDLEARARAALACQPEFASVELESVARVLEISTRTLRRELSARGVSFRALKGRMGRERATRLLAEGASTEEISVALGFSEPSAFRRAFKRWTGQTPAQFVDAKTDSNPRVRFNRP